MPSPTFPSTSDATNTAKDALNTASDAANQAANKATEYGRDALNQAANKATEYGRDAVDKLDSSRDTVAQGIHATADAIRSYAPDSMADHARTTADAMESAADYIRSRDLRSMTTDLTEAVRRNPGPSLIAAVAIGFLLGVGLRRRD